MVVGRISGQQFFLSKKSFKFRCPLEKKKYGNDNILGCKNHNPYGFYESWHDNKLRSLHQNPGNVMILDMAKKPSLSTTTQELTNPVPQGQCAWSSLQPGFGTLWLSPYGMAEAWPFWKSLLFEEITAVVNTWFRKQDEEFYDDDPTKLERCCLVKYTTYSFLFHWSIFPKL